jgi:hypothetical protein
VARINVDDGVFLDPRFKEFCKLVGSEELALGCLLKAWSMAQFFWRKNKQKIPYRNFTGLKHFEEMLSTGLGVKTKDRVYMAGTKDSFEWLMKLQEAGKRGGKRSAELRRDVSQARANTNEISKPFQASSSHVNPLTLALTLAPTLTLNKTNTATEPPADATAVRLESVFESYPKRNGDHRRAQGLRKLAREIKTDEDLASLEAAVKNYSAHCEARKITGTEFVKQFATWCSSWREWVEIKNPVTAPKTKRERKTKEELDAELEALYAAEEKKLEQEILNRGN